MHAKLKTLLFETASRTYAQLYAIVDSAVDGMIDGHFESDEPWKQILYRDEEDRRTLERKAPHLVLLKEDHPFTERLFEEGYGKNWGCFLLSKEEFSALSDHLSRYTKVYSQVHEQDVYVRFYDPRAMHKYFSMFQLEEGVEFFSKMEAIYVEKENSPSTLLHYKLNVDNRIQRHEIDL